MKMMKFSELVQCWGQPEMPQRSEEAGAETAGAEVASGGRKRAESSGRGSKHAVVWRPSLGAISEDKAAKATATATAEECRRKERTGKSKKEVVVKDRSQKAPKVRARDDRDRYGQVGVPTVIPAFTPTAFLF